MPPPRALVVVCVIGLVLTVAPRAPAQQPLRPALTRQQAHEDLDQLHQALRAHYSYLKLKGVDVPKELESIRSRLKDENDRDEFGIELMKMLALFGDGHTRLNGLPLPPGYLPFDVAEAEGRLVALKDDRSDFVDPGYPFLVSLDGVELSRWLEVSSMLSGGSAHFKRMHAVRALRFITYLRGQLGLDVNRPIKVELESAREGDRKTMELAVSNRRPSSGGGPRGTSRKLAGNIGYLRIASMSESRQFIEAVHRSMNDFRDTAGLIIDVRGNGGGSRAALRELFPYFMTRTDSPRVANVAAYRRGPDEPADAPEGYLANRFLYPVGSRVWSEAERAVIRDHAATFNPEWNPPADQFSAWHYFLLSPVPDRPHYEKPVVVLLDAGCFSATDIFLGAFKGWRNVTLMGSTSGGGSGRARPLQLTHSGIRLQFSSMASFQASGLLYDGRGIEPDVEALPTATDLIGKTDTVLDAARERLR
jgi:hypothetical protein